MLPVYLILGETAKMLSEAALCFVLENLSEGGGILTPAVAFGAKLISRLTKAGTCETWSSMNSKFKYSIILLQADHSVPEYGCQTVYMTTILMTLP